MQSISTPATPGEHPLLLQGRIGQLEAILTLPEAPYAHYIALLGHPHSLQGGTMQNKVVTTLARLFKSLHIPSLRFNFRGVGLSEGTYDAGVGESEDMLALTQLWQQTQPLATLIFAGFSFGSYVAYRAASQHKNSHLITIAPPVHHYPYSPTTELASWLIVQGDADEVVPAEAVLDFAKQASPPIPVMQFTETGHFFHGKLQDLKTRLTDYMQRQDPNL